MKQLTVVFPVFSEAGKDLILMGRQAAGKRMPGIRNGPGGKCEEGELPEDCAVREVREEIGVELNTGDLKHVGLLVEGDKQVYFYTARLPEKIDIADNDEMVDVRWFAADAPESYVGEMLPGNGPIMQEVSRSLASPAEFKPFSFDFSDNEELREATKNIFSGTTTEAS